MYYDLIHTFPFFVFSFYNISIRRVIVMKIKLTLVTLSLIIAMVSGVKSNYFNKTKEMKNLNTVSNQEVVIEDQSIINENDQADVEQEQIDNNEIKNEEPKEIAQEPIVQETPKTTNSQNNKTTKKTETVTKQPTTQETTPKQEPKKESVVETPKKEEKPQQQVTKTITESDLEYWCVGGGKHHVAGDKSNEHGYYSSWNEANQAFENYTKGWASVQYKISQCSCGLYYFWAIK